MKTSSSKSLVKAVALITFFSVMTRALSFFYKIILSRMISTEMLGAYSLGMSVYTVLTTCINSGIPLSVSKATASNYVEDNRRNIGSAVSSALLLSLSMVSLMCIAVFAGKPLLISMFGNTDSYFILALLIPTIISTAIYTPFRGYLWGKEEYFKVGLVEFIEQALRLTLLVVGCLAFTNTNELFPAGISYAIAGISTTILGICFFFKEKGNLAHPKYQFKSMFKTSAPITGVRIATSILQPLISIIVPMRLVAVGFSQEQALSEIGVTMGMTFPLLTIPSTLIGALAMVLIPKLTSLVNTHSSSSAIRNQLNSAIMFTICCSFISIPVFIALGTPACEFVYANSLAGKYLAMGSWLVLPMCMAMTCSSALNSLGQEMSSFKYNIFASVITLVLAWFLPKHFGVFTLLLVSGISMAIVSVLSLRKINKLTHIGHKYITKTIILALITIPVTLLTKYTYNLCAVVFPSLVAIFLAGMISVIAFALLMACFKIIDMSYLKDTFARRKVKKQSIK